MSVAVRFGNSQILLKKFKHLCRLDSRQYGCISSQVARSVMTPTNDLDKKLFLTDKHSSFTFDDIHRLSSRLSSQVLDKLNKQTLAGEKIGIYCTNNYSYLISILATWMAGGVPFCLSKFYPSNYLEYFFKDSKCKLVINSSVSGSNNQQGLVSDEELSQLLKSLKVQNHVLVENEFHKDVSRTTASGGAFKNMRALFDAEDRRDKEAMLLYTSGTSGPAKGVSLTFENLFSSIETMIESWKWASSDKILHTLPLHHFSGLVYCLLTPFYVGAQVDMLPKFDATRVWSKLLDETNQINVFIGVPTIYVNLVSMYLANPQQLINGRVHERDQIRDILRRKMRIIGTGSAPLNVKTYNDWYDITHYRILERYGMTEVGMVLSNPYDETQNSQRIAGTVGRPCHTALCRIVETGFNPNEEHNHVLVESDSKNDRIMKTPPDGKNPFGELQVKGPMVFKKYQNKPEQTKESFTQDGWFKTGDTAEFMMDKKIYKIIGRTSVDVIKSGGYKISALDIEREVLAHPNVDDVAIIGLSDPTWGQRIFALIVPKKSSDGKSFDEKEFIQWCKQKLPKYQVPKQVKLIDKMPRNLLGKVNKKELVKIYEAESSGQ